jgi:hypothetical protein
MKLTALSNFAIKRLPDAVRSLNGVAVSCEAQQQVLRILPEAKGRSLEEIEDALVRKKL